MANPNNTKFSEIKINHQHVQVFDDDDSKVLRQKIRVMNDNANKAKVAISQLSALIVALNRQLNP